MATPMGKLFYQPRIYDPNLHITRYSYLIQYSYLIILWNPNFVRFLLSLTNFMKVWHV